MPDLSAWLRWQLPYAMSCYAHPPVAAAKRLLPTRKRAMLGFDPFWRRLRDKWGALPDGLLRGAGERRPVWINMNSGGETMQSLTLLRRLAERERLALSTESYDCLPLLREVVGADDVFFPPWDTGLAVRRSLERIRPRALVFVQNAYFPVLLRQARRAGVTTLLVNGLLSRNAERANPWMARALGLGFHRELDGLAVQTEEDRAAFLRLGVPPERLVVTGNLATDLDGIQLTAEERSARRRALGLAEAQPVWIVGSTHPAEGPALLEAHREVRRRVPEARGLIVPRWVHEARAMAAWFARQGVRVALKTARGAAGRPGPSDYDLMVIDEFGQLRALYGIADAAYIGASLVPTNAARGGHHPLEPLAHGVIPLFGPHMNLWQPIVRRLREAWPALEVDSADALGRRLADVLLGHAPAHAVRQVGQELVRQAGGAAQRTLEFLTRQLGLREFAPHDPGGLMPIAGPHG